VIRLTAWAGRIMAPHSVRDRRTRLTCRMTLLSAGGAETLGSRRYSLCVKSVAGSRPIWRFQPLACGRREHSPDAREICRAA
jgi:hypothetical protein